MSRGPPWSLTLSNNDASQKGAALLAVLWLTAALSAIAFTVANTVRSETERSSTDSEGMKAYYLAGGAIDRMLLYIELGPAFSGPDGKPIIEDNTRVLPLNFPTGFVLGEFIPETSKLNVNTAPPRELKNLLLALGVEPARAEAITAGHPGLEASGLRRVVHPVRSTLLVAHSVFSGPACVSSRD